MGISKAQIFNIALNILGVSTPLENTQKDDSKAILLNNYYELARDYVLKDFDWNFASCFSNLAPAETSISINNFQYNYFYPNDCIAARDIFEKNSYVIQKYSVSILPDNTKIISTNAKQAVLRYTKRIDKEIFFTCEFSMALAYYLASLTANVIVGSVQKQQSAYEHYRQLIKRAKVLNAQEGIENIYEDTTYIDSRN